MAGFGDPHLDTVDAHGLKLGIVGSRWHSGLVDHMVERAQEAAKACGVDDVVTVRVAGSVELPVVAQALAQRCDAVVALGVVIRGETAHFDYVCDAVTAGLSRVRPAVTASPTYSKWAGSPRITTPRSEKH